MVGGYSTCNGDAGSFVWTAGQFVTPLTFVPAVTSSSPSGINSQEQIVGTKEDTIHSGFLYQNGTWSDLGVLPGANFGEATAINESGQICGYVNNVITGPLRAFIWQNGVMTDLGIQGVDNSVANAINNDAQIVGWMGVVPTPPFFGVAYIWNAGRVTELAMPLGGLNSVARGINSITESCGYYVLPNPSGPGYVTRACRWSNGTVIDLGVLPLFTKSIAADISDQGQIVGACSGGTSGAAGPAFVWQNGVMYSLDDLIPANAAVSLIDAVAINNHGQIAALGMTAGSQQVAVLLTPIPPVLGDVNCDQVVNMDDLLGVVTHWGMTQDPADLNGNGIVELGDLVIVLEEWSF